ncbi:MAG: hypothetical protein Ct9H300mP7_4670 [Verrucomicrobiota bacterium]|nr:MAG: hypothetical protein Ct9H300mP7_4670 [Verrucomicrobiota bacterium]
MEPKADIALFGLAVMGQNLILNMNDHGFTVVAYNRTVSKVDDFIMTRPRTPTSSVPTRSRKWSATSNGRAGMMLVKAGQPVDDFIDRVIPYLDPG